MKLSLVLGAVLCVGCGSSDSNNGEKTCDPGATQKCDCTGGAQGVQTCEADGMAWDKCDCPKTDPDAGPKPAPDGGGPVPDKGTTPSPDKGTTPGTKSCAEVIQCVQGCGTSESCANNCVAEANSIAAPQVTALNSCLENAAAGSCKSQCSDQTSDACRGCVQTACQSEIATCLGTKTPPQDAGPPADQGIGTSCAEIVKCIEGCSAQACVTMCIALGNPGAEAAFNTMNNCINGAVAGSCAGSCADTSSAACQSCVGTACNTEIQACLTAP